MTDNRRIVDPELEWEADHSGVIHLRKHPGETQFLEGYGTTDMGVSPFVKKSFFTPNIFIGAGLAAAGFIGWRFREQIAPQFENLAEAYRTRFIPQVQAIGDYALLLRESFRA